MLILPDEAVARSPLHAIGVTYIQQLVLPSMISDGKPFDSRAMVVVDPERCRQCWNHVLVSLRGVRGRTTAVQCQLTGLRERQKQRRVDPHGRARTKRQVQSISLRRGAVASFKVAGDATRQSYGLSTQPGQLSRDGTAATLVHNPPQKLLRSRETYPNTYFAHQNKALSPSCRSRLSPLSSAFSVCLLANQCSPFHVLPTDYRQSPSPSRSPEPCESKTPTRPPLPSRYHHNQSASQDGVANATKVKTTAPKQYCVRPNSGRVEPGQDVEVTGMEQCAKNSQRKR